MNWRTMGVGGAGVCVGIGVAVGGAGVCVGAAVDTGVAVGADVEVGAVVGASAVVAAGAVVAVGAGVCVSAGAVVAVGSAAVVGVGAGVGEHAISSEIATMDITTNSARLVVILIVRLGIVPFIHSCSYAVGQPHSLANGQRAWQANLCRRDKGVACGAQAPVAPTALLRCPERLRREGRGGELESALEIGVGFAAAALAYDLYALGGGYGFG